MSNVAAMASGYFQPPAPVIEMDIPLSPEEKEEIFTFDSLQFGFWNPCDPNESTKKMLIIRGINYYERVLLENKTKAILNDAEMTKSFLVLGHLHLLIGDFGKALSAYQHHFRRQPDYWKDSAFLYGLGLVYFYYNLLEWTTRAFTQLRSSDPNFARIKEVNLRLGMAYKMLGDFPKSLMYFQLASDDPSECSLSKYEIDFHICHLHETQGDAVKAKDFYLLLLSHEDLPPLLKTAVLRQLSWLFMCAEQLGEAPQRNQAAYQYLQEAVRIDNNDPQNYYLLGRCYAALGMVQQAFHYYRSAIDKSESNADTWCSIGVLYQQQCQAMDSLQAYICSIQLDSQHIAAWTNLGILYDQHSQFRDALRCYQNALQFNRTGAKNVALEERFRVLEETLQKIPSESVETTPPTLPSLDQAWKLPIPSDLNHRQQTKHPNISHLPTATQSQYPPWWPSPQNRLQNGPPSVPGGPNPLIQLGSASSVSRSIQIAAIQMNERKKKRKKKDTDGNPLASSPCNASTTPLPSESLPNPTSNQSQEVIDKAQPSENTEPVPITQISETCQSEKAKQTELSSENKPEQSESMDVDNTESHSQINGNGMKNGDATIVESKQEAVAVESSTGGVDVIYQLPDMPDDLPDTDKRPEISIEMTGEQIFTSCKSNIPYNRHFSIYLRDVLPKITRPQGPPLPKDQLVPPITTLIVETKRDAQSIELKESCLATPICIIRGLATALKMDLSLFSTKKLVECHPDHPVEVRTQFLQSADDNRDSTGVRTWRCESARSFTSIQRYAVYQAQTFQDSLNDEKAHVFRTLGNGVKGDALEHHGSTTHSLAGPLLPNNTPNIRKQIRFGTNVDLSNEQKWMQHIHELAKLPTFLRVHSASNMLSHVGYTVQGMNSIQLYMKVPGCRTPGHQENLNFASINVNIGPGECEWFGVSQEYLGPFVALCKEQGVDFASGSWWPLMEHLYRENIPVCRFIQRPGDIVWVGPGTVHWVQANGWCNNIAWNVGPLTVEQYNSVVDRYEFNKAVHYKSLVPVVQLSWNLAQNLRMSDPALHRTIKTLLAQSLRQQAVALGKTEELGKKLTSYPRKENEPAHYCMNCEAEVFNLLFVREREKKYLVFCLDCALKLEENLNSFTVLNQYELRDLFCIFDSFQVKVSVQ